MRIPLDNPPAPSTLFGVPDSNAAFGRHAGIDFPVGIGTPVYACISGTLSIIKLDQYHGNVVDIQNGDRWYRVMHLSEFVRFAGAINEGELIAYSGNTGLSIGPHVHWDIRTQYVATSFAAFIDPFKALQEVQVMDENGIRYGYLAVTAAQPTQEQINYWKGRSPTEFTQALYKLSDSYIVALKKRVVELEALGIGSFVPVGTLYTKK